MNRRRLREARQRKGWTQARTAAMASMSPQDYSALETGRRPAYPAWRRRLSLVFGVPEAALFDAEDCGTAKDTSNVG